MSFTWLYETIVVGWALIFSSMTYLGLCFSMWFVEESRRHPVSSIISFEQSLVCFEIDVLPDLYCWRWTTVVNCIMFYIQCTRTMYAANQPSVHWTCERATSTVTACGTVPAYENEIIMRWSQQKPPQIFPASIPLKLTHFNCMEACCSKKWDSSSGDFEILHVFSDQNSTLAI